jgi:NAD(P)-dependent dehydrogenase (short-subunit alcohol dehydrogenase family)
MATLPSLSDKVALVTGAARRIGAAISRCLHADGASVVVHYRGSADEAMTLCDELNALRPDSAMPIQADLADTERLPDLVAALVGEGESAAALTRAEEVLTKLRRGRLLSKLCGLAEHVVSRELPMPAVVAAP